MTGGPFVHEGADRRKTSAFVGTEHAFDVLEMIIGHGKRWSGKAFSQSVWDLPAMI
ncbi:MAG: hypothetical protein ACTHOJ_00650 [Sphingomonas oligoaromativorans]